VDAIEDADREHNRSRDGRKLVDRMQRLHAREESLFKIRMMARRSRPKR
jgi:hypothetical protein